MGVGNKYSIDYMSLSSGLHTFDFEVDDALLLETLHTKGLESTAYRVSADSDETSESLIRYIFNEDGTCQLFSTLDDLRVNYTSSYGEKNIGVCSRIFDWNYDEETNTITT